MQKALPFYTHHYPQSTIGSIYARGNADLRDAVLGVRIIDGQARELNFGGTVMKNVAGYDIARLLAGSQGKLAIICDISLKVFPKAYLTDLEHIAIKQCNSSPARQRIEDGLKEIFDPNHLFV